MAHSSLSTSRWVVAREVPAQRRTLNMYGNSASYSAARDQLGSPYALGTPLLELLYDELKRMARGHMSRERPDHTLQATALVNEVFLKLQARESSTPWQTEADFLAAASEAMRRILVDHARARLSQKRAGEMQRCPLGDVPFELPLAPCDLVAVHEALDHLAAESPIKAQLVKLRVFVGMTQADAADELNISRATADRYWKYAKVRLFTIIRGKKAAEAP